jgi:hypothetical protein
VVENKDTREWMLPASNERVQCAILLPEGRKLGVYPQRQSRGQPTRRQVLWTVAAFAFLTVAILIGYRYGIMLWDWLDLLVVPAVIAAGGLWFNRQQRERELAIAERRTQDEALQANLNQMSDMLIPTKEQPSLYKARPGDSLSSVARARTLTVLPRLDGERKGQVMQFLYEAGLIAKRRPVLDLSDADLRRVMCNELDQQVCQMA